jgi:hypothetical protein
MAIELRVPKVFFCPRCDRGFSSIISNLRGRTKMINHLKKAHPDYYERMWRD